MPLASPSYIAILFCQLAAGAASGLLFLACVRFISIRFSGRQLKIALSIFGCGFGLSEILSYLLFPLMVIGKDWRLPLIFICIAGAGLFLLELVAVRLNRVYVSLPVKKGTFRLESIINRVLIGVTLPNFALVAIIVGVTTWVPIYFTSALYLNNINAGRLASSLGTTNIIASLAGGAIAIRFGAIRAIVLSMIFSMLFTVLLGLVHSSTIALICVGGLGFATALPFASIFTLIPAASKQNPELAGLSFGIFNTISNMGGILSPILLGYVLQATSDFRLAFTSIGLFAILGLVGTKILAKERDNLTEGTMSVSEERV